MAASSPMLRLACLLCAPAVARALHLGAAQESAALATEAAPRQRAITFVTLRDEFFETNLGRSPLWLSRGTLPHEWKLLDNPQNAAISALYAQAKSEAKNELVVCLHSDVFLPATFYDELMQRLDSLDSFDPNWGVAGMAGVVGPDATVVLSLRDSYATQKDLNSASATLPAEAFDELLIILRKSNDVNFDPELPGFDMYGTDIVLASKAQNLSAYVVPAYVEHKVYDQDGQLYRGAEHMKKIITASYLSRVNKTGEHMLRKWCPRKPGCNIGLFFMLNCMTGQVALRGPIPEDLTEQAKATGWEALNYTADVWQQCLIAREHPGSVAARYAQA
mmetsp:Transcript_29095/g.90697  ORF Transcript_29095/g.90697 Transcript_29095/m.90697 type:complete len:334 (-) Transcript_29095:62-1063(-)